MKTFKNIAVALALTIILFAGCKNPAEDVEIIVNTDIFKSPTLLQFINAKKGGTKPKDFTITFSGPGASLLRTTTGGQSFKVSDGLINLVLDRSANPSPTSPVKFTAIISAPGFAPTIENITITDAKEPTFLKIPLTEYANPADGFSAIIDTKVLTNNSTSTDISIKSPINSGVAESSLIVIPSNTNFKDATGQIITGGQLETRIVYSGTPTTIGNPSIPGGIVSENVVDINGQKLPAQRFNPVGVMSIDMFIGGKQVKSFSKPVSMEMEISPKLINPNTNQPLKVGETIPQWSMEESTGQIKREGDATVVLNANGKLAVKAIINHLSFEFPAFFTLSSLPASCTNSLKINAPATNYDKFFEVAAGGGSLHYQTKQTVKIPAGQTSVTVQIESLGQGLSFTVAYGYFGAPQGIYTETYEKGVLTLNAPACSTTSELTFVPAQSTLNVDVDVNVKCEGKALLTGLNAMAVVTNMADNDDQLICNVVNGKASVKLKLDKEYLIEVSIDGKTYTGRFTARKSTFTLPKGYDLDGTAVFNGDKLTVSGTVIKKDCN
ncbi:MAG: hypothetical protein ACQUHE_02900 [Bacteroidia bacterium]